MTLGWPIAHPSTLTIYFRYFWTTPGAVFGRPAPNLFLPSLLFDESRYRSKSMSIKVDVDITRFHKFTLKVFFSESARKMTQNGDRVVAIESIFFMTHLLAKPDRFSHTPWPRNSTKLIPPGLHIRCRN